MKKEYNLDSFLTSLTNLQKIKDEQDQQAREQQERMCKVRELLQAFDSGIAVSTELLDKLDYDVLADTEEIFDNIYNNDAIDCSEEYKIVDEMVAITILKELLENKKSSIVPNTIMLF